MNPDNLYPPPFHGNGGYTDNFGRPHRHTVHGAMVEIMNPYVGGGFAVGPQVISGPVGSAGPAGTGAVGNAAWGGVYDTTHTQM